MLLQAAGASDWDYLAAASDALSQESSGGACRGGDHGVGGARRAKGKWTEM